MFGRISFMICLMVAGALVVVSTIPILGRNVDSIRAWHGDDVIPADFIPEDLATSYLIYAHNRFNKGDWVGAESILRVAIELPIQERSPLWMFHLAYVLSKQGKSAEATSVWRQSGLSMVPPRFCGSLLRDGKLEQALDWCRDLPAITPNAENYCLRAEYLRRAQDYAGAEKDFTSAIATGSASAECLANFAKLLYAQQRYSEALRVWEQAVVRDPQVTFLVELGYTLHRLGRIEDALDILESAYSRASTPQERTVATIALGGIYYHIGDYLRAKNYIEEGISIGKSVDPSTYRLLARIERRLGNSNSSILAYKRAISGIGKSPDPLLLAYRHELAEYLTELGRLDEARAVYLDILLIAPNDQKAREATR